MEGGETHKREGREGRAPQKVGGTRGRAGVCALCVPSPSLGILVGTLQAAMPGSHRHPALQTTGHVLKEGPTLQNRRGSPGEVAQSPLHRPQATEVWPELRAQPAAGLQELSALKGQRPGAQGRQEATRGTSQLHAGRDAGPEAGTGPTQGQWTSRQKENVLLS